MDSYEEHCRTWKAKSDAYYESTRGKASERHRLLRLANLEAKRYYCDACNRACGSAGELKKHLSTLKHAVHVKEIDEKASSHPKLTQA